MISPYVRRMRLARELRELRSQAGLTHNQLAKAIGQSRAQISRLENAHVVDVGDVMKILEALDINDERWTRVVTIAREAAEKGWWESAKGMGARQALYADFEAGATDIREFQMVFLPGLMQTDDFTRARAETDRRLGGPIDYVPDKVIDARHTRQRMLRRPGGPSYHVVVDEVAIRRASAPPEVLKAQLYHITASVNANPKIRLQVLPVDVTIEDYTLPRSAFSIYTFADSEDPGVVAVDTVTEDVVLTEERDLKSYDELFNRLVDAAWDEAESLDFLIRHARRI